jgi:asparagine synthase (glutamine-hydrolysing)
MCGIAGFLSSRPTAGIEAILRRMTDAIRHRGPDDCGFYHDEYASLGHRRLSIIDVAGGHQPMANETRSCWIVYNGEIFNHLDLRPELEKAGHRYRSRCDTETILHAFEEYGPSSLSRYRGMFSFAIWDKEAKTLFCARDRLGIKPFYYYWNGATFVFASEIKALLEHPSVPTALEESLLEEYLAFGYSSGGGTLFRGIRKLLPGHHLTLSLSGPEPALTLERYWDAPDSEASEPHPEQWWTAELRRRLEETVRMRLMSDVPLGLFLSGGVDSSAVAALVRRSTSGPVKTFAVGYAEERFSELDYARQVAHTIGTEHHEIRVSQDQFFHALPRLIWHEDEPITWPSSVSLYFVSRLAAEQVKVVLTGEGSDELFGGYERYRWNLLNQKGVRLWALAPSALRSLVSRRIAHSNLLRASLRRKLSHTFLGRDASLESLYLDNFYSAFSHSGRRSLLAGSFDSAYGAYLSYWNARPSFSLLGRMLYADQKTYLVELLMKQDQMSMAASIESRVPFLDHTFVEFAARIPDHLKISGREQKYILKKAVEDLLPPAIIYRKKMGFPTPLRHWLANPSSDPLFQALLDPKGFLAAYVRIPELRTLLERHRGGLVDATDRIWRLLNLQIWANLFLTGKRDLWWDGVPSSPVSSQLVS